MCSDTPATMAREVYFSSDPEQLLQIIDDLESDYSDDDFDGYIDDDDEEIQERMTRVGEIGSSLGTDWGAGDGMEGLSGGLQFVGAVMMETLVLEWKWN